ncbi:MAG: hypothetical protein ACRDQ9_04540 [Pseudonocardiaceae bacterium]
MGTCNNTHKLTTRLVAEHDTIVIEDLHVAGMIRNRRLARAISGLGMRSSESQALPRRTQVRVQHLRHPARPGHQRREEPGRTGGSGRLGRVAP